jgi:NTP pyrophosphatase (non-canonical NTP hydrolase)
MRTGSSTIINRAAPGREDSNVEELRVDVKAFIEERDWAQFHSPKNLAMALSVEVSEVVEHFQWLTEEQSRNLSAEKLADVREEIGDVMIYLTELADKLGLDPVEAARTKVAINKEKYPADLVRGNASKYTEY